MSDSQKKQTFLHGAALLAIAAAIVKIIGAFYKIPLKMVIDDQGYGYFNTAYEAYSVLLMISTVGLPVAMSRMISQASALGNYNQVRRIYKTAQAIFLTLGVFSCAVMMLFSHQLANLLRQPNAWVAMLCLGPSAIFMALTSTFRGFFQGQGNMKPTSVSQVLEALFKLLIGLGLAYLVMKLTNSLAYAAGAAILGVTASCLVSTLFLNSKFRPSYRTLPQTDDTALTFGATAKALLAIAIPITIGSAGMQAITLAEQRVYMGQLMGSLGMSQADADVTKGIYSFTLTLYNMPVAFIMPITISVLPAITNFLTLNDHAGVRDTEESAARVASLISLPCAVGLLLMAGPITSLLGGYTGEKLEVSTKLMSVLAICVFLYAMVQYTTVVLQAHGKPHLPVINMLSCAVVRLGIVYFLSGNPNIGIIGVPVGAALCYGSIAILNLICIRFVVAQKPRLVRNLLRSAPPALIMGVVVFGCNWLLGKFLGEDASRIILCGVPIAVGVVVYFVCAVLCKSITAADCKLLPKGDKIAKLLKL